MPYTDTTFDPTQPPGGEFLSLGDDEIRKAKLDLKERLESFFKSIDDDPLVPVDNSIPGSAIKAGSIVGSSLDPTLNLKSIIIATISISDTIPALSGAFIGGGTHAVVGAELGDAVLLTWADGDGRFCLNGAVTAPGQVTVAYANMTSGAITLADKSMLVVVIKPGVPGQPTGSIAPIIVPHTEFQPDSQIDTLSYTTIEATPNANAAMTLLAGVTLPVGTKISTVSITIRADNTATLTGHFYKINAGVTFDLWPFSATVGGGVQTLAPGAGIDYTVGSGDYFVFSVDIDTSTSTNANDAAVRFAGVTPG